VNAPDPLAACGLAIMFEDDDLVVVDKPSGMPSVPARTAADPPDVAAVLASTHGPLEAVHRLDRDTSGLLVLARSRAARTALGRAFESGAVGKRYRAVVRGVPPGREGTIHMPLADDPVRPPRKRVDPILGRRAASRWSMAAEPVVDPRHGGSLTLLDLEPLTGRSHQLRVHLAWLGCPITGDRLYGAAVVDEWPLALRAVAITFPHPRTGERVAMIAAPAAPPPWAWFTASRRQAHSGDPLAGPPR